MDASIERERILNEREERILRAEKVLMDNKNMINLRYSHAKYELRRREIKLQRWEESIRIKQMELASRELACDQWESDLLKLEEQVYEDRQEMKKLRSRSRDFSQ